MIAAEDRRIDSTTPIARAAQYYPVARLVHLERLAAGAPVELIYATHRQDWNEQLAAATPGVHRRGLLGAMAHLWRTDYDVVEIPEPLAIPLLPHALSAVLVLRAKRLLKRHDTALAYYAIENLDQAGKLAAATRLPYGLARAAVRVAAGAVSRSTARIAYGTEGTRENYLAALGRVAAPGRRRQVRSFEALPSPDPEPIAAKDPGRLVYLGSFERRKGIDLVMRAWPEVHERMPAATLTVIGHGPLESEVREWAAAHADAGVELLVDPPRPQIVTALREAHCLVLPSVRTPTWREQVGLPILEGLAEGCEIVTSDETGIAQWLRDNGHEVLGGAWGEPELAAALVAALGKTRSPQEVQAALPAQDSRLAAQLWMLGAE